MFLRNYRWLFFLLISSIPISAISSTLQRYQLQSYAGYGFFPSAQLACERLKPSANGAQAILQSGGTACYIKPDQFSASYFASFINSSTLTCPYGDNGSVCNASCVSPKTMVGGQCVSPPPAVCPVGQKDVGQGCAPFACAAVSDGHSGPDYPSVYSPEQGSCVKIYALKDAEYCSFGGSNGFKTHAPQEVNTSDPDSLTQGVNSQKCGISIKKKECTTNVDGSHHCVFEGNYDGTYHPTAQEDNTSNCPESGCTAKPPEPQPLPAPEPEKTNESTPCVYTGSSGSLSCTSENNEEIQGTKNCGTVNGVWGCQKTPPTKNGILIHTQLETVTNPDGSTKTTKTDTATQTKCTDIGTCTSTESKVVTVTNKDGTGTTTSVTGTCTGKGCPDKNGNPDGDGDGFGDCIGDDCGEGEGGGGPSDWYEPADDTYESVINDFADSVSQIPVVSGVGNFLTFTPSGACPVYEVSVWAFNIRLDQWCTGSTIPWDLISAVVIACCAFFAFRIAFM